MKKPAPSPRHEPRAIPPLDELGQEEELTTIHCRVDLFDAITEVRDEDITAVDKAPHTADSLRPVVGPTAGEPQQTVSSKLRVREARRSRLARAVVMSAAALVTLGALAAVSVVVRREGSRLEASAAARFASAIAEPSRSLVVAPQPADAMRVNASPTSPEPPLVEVTALPSIASKPSRAYASPSQAALTAPKPKPKPVVAEAARAQAKPRPAGRAQQQQHQQQDETEVKNALDADMLARAQLEASLQ